MGYCKASRASHLNDVVFHPQTKRFNIANEVILLILILFSQHNTQMKIIKSVDCKIESSTSTSSVITTYD